MTSRAGLALVASVSRMPISTTLFRASRTSASMRCRAKPSCTASDSAASVRIKASDMSRGWTIAPFTPCSTDSTCGTSCSQYATRSSKLRPGATSAAELPASASSRSATLESRCFRTGAFEQSAAQSLQARCKPFVPSNCSAFGEHGPQTVRLQTLQWCRGLNSRLASWTPQMVHAGSKSQPLMVGTDVAPGRSPPSATKLQMLNCTGAEQSLSECEPLSNRPRGGISDPESLVTSRTRCRFEVLCKSAASKFISPLQCGSSCRMSPAGLACAWEASRAVAPFHDPGITLTARVGTGG
mmetsp:Transcript_113082/g.320010  ORF Transcript_113082/g.320010 Transcript_113082/m.320010 type:complete len:298 (-) Transcript_113082:18-911(-)